MLYNQAGYKAEPVGWEHPKLGTGAAVTAGATDTDLTVEAGRRFMFHNIDTTYSAFIGFADLGTAANRLWVINPGEHVGVNVPVGVTSLRVRRTASNDCSLHRVELEG